MLTDLGHNLKCSRCHGLGRDIYSPFKLQCSKFASITATSGLKSLGLQLGRFGKVGLPSHGHVQSSGCGSLRASGTLSRHYRSTEDLLQDGRELFTCPQRPEQARLVSFSTSVLVSGNRHLAALCLPRTLCPGLRISQDPTSCQCLASACLGPALGRSRMCKAV